MDPRFDELATDPWNQVFQVVFFPDRIYHAQYLNATRSPRYRYNVREVRGKADINVLKGEVYFDGLKLCNFLRLEYRASRLVEVARERNRFLGSSVLADLKLVTDGGSVAQGRLSLDFCPWINAYQVECWETLEPPLGKRHDYQVLSMMGYKGAITVLPQLGDVLKDLKSIKWVNVSFRESEISEPSGFFVAEDQASKDNYYNRNIQVPNTNDPSSFQNTVREDSYGVNFQRGWFIKNVSEIKPVRYVNAMMNDENPDRGPNNIVEMRWILQQEFGGTVVFFHEVTIPPGVVEGTHQHIGSEELYYVIEGHGIAYLGENDDPQLSNEPVVTRDIYGIGPKQCRELQVGPGSVIFTKSGGIHGIRNSGGAPLRFAAFLYHSA
jgi:oxalate decarboxylase/phosphoglucose isomerase-like protein (cupin superfamily)